MAIYIYIAVALIVGILMGLLAQLGKIGKLRKENKSLNGMLESERLMRETAQKENAFLLQSADAALLTTKDKLKRAEDIARQMDSDIILLQKSNEETEAQMANAEPALHELKLKLIEANNTIARLKAQYEK